MSEGKYITIKVFRTTRRTAKILAVNSGETLAEFLDRLINEEANRQGIEAYAAAHPRKGAGGNESS